MPKFMYTFHLFKFAFRTMARSHTTHIGSVFNCLVVSVVCSFSFSPDIIIPFIFSVIPLYFGVHEKKPTETTAIRDQKHQQKFNMKPIFRY